MKVKDLFDVQRKLDERIVREKGLEGQDLLPSRILALQVELGELANEWRGFKFWSDDREPRTKAYPKGTCTCKDCDSYWCDKLHESTAEAKGIYVNPLLEEYVDCLHFILSIGLELNYDLKKNPIPEGYKDENEIQQFNRLFDRVGDLSAYPSTGNYFYVFELFLGLREMLGFTWHEVVEAYIEKNQENHHRQTSGY